MSEERLETLRSRGFSILERLAELYQYSVLDWYKEPAAEAAKLFKLLTSVHGSIADLAIDFPDLSGQCNAIQSAMRHHPSVSPDYLRRLTAPPILRIGESI